MLLFCQTNECWTMSFISRSSYGHSTCRCAIPLRIDRMCVRATAIIATYASTRTKRYPPVAYERVRKRRPPRPLYAGIVAKEQNAGARRMGGCGCGTRIADLYRVAAQGENNTASR